MERLERAAIILQLTEDLRSWGSWCGETHVQKATYFLQELTEVPLEYNFILYKHGPFSFDLRDQITEMRADEIFVLESQPAPYGPSIVAGPNGALLKGAYEYQMAKYGVHRNFVATHLDKLGVADLERLATALYVTVNSEGESSVFQRAKDIVRLKPHVTAEQAHHAVKEVDRMSGAWRACVVVPDVSLA